MKKSKKLQKQLDVLTLAIQSLDHRVGEFEACMFGATSLSGKAIGMYEKVHRDSTAYVTQLPFLITANGGIYQAPFYDDELPPEIAYG